MFQSAKNSTNVPLPAGLRFTGTPEDVTMYKVAIIKIYTDTDCTLTVNYTNKSALEKAYLIAANKKLIIRTKILPDPSRLYITCDNTSDIDQTFLQLEVYYSVGQKSPLMLDTGNDARNARAARGSIELDNPGIITLTATPVVLVDFKYTVPNPRRIRTITNGAGTAATINDLFMSVRSGSSSSGYAICESAKQLCCKSGSTASCKFTSVFSTPMADNEMYVGMGNSTSGLFVGYNGTQFGIMRRFGGETEVQRLTVTNGTIGVESAAITLNGVTFNRSIDANSLPSQVAHQLMTKKYAGWETCCMGADVYFISLFHGPQPGQFSYIGVASGGTFTRVTAGLASQEIWVPQTSFSHDVMDGSGTGRNSSGWLLDPKNLNTFQIKYQWMEGNVTFHLAEPLSGNYLTFHKIRYAGRFNFPSINNPYLKMQWITKNKGNTNSRILKGSSGYLGLEGALSRNDITMSKSASKQIGSSVMTNVLTIRCRRTHVSGVKLYGEMILEQLCICGSGLDSGERAHVSIILDATVTTPLPEYTSVNPDSIAVYDVTGGQAQGGTGTEILSACAKETCNVIDLRSYNITLQPGESLTVAGQIMGAVGTADLFASLMWREDY